MEKYRHTLAHLLGAAVLELYPGSKLTLGPAIEDGFYYDIDVEGKISEDDLKNIEKKMSDLLKSWESFSHKEVSQEEALEVYKDNEYKKELIQEIGERGEKITLYTSGDFTDLCRGGHLENPKQEIQKGSWKLDRISGAYWRGSEKNKMLTRIYGIAFESNEKLKEFEEMRREAEKRDHRKIGQEQKLFFIDEMVGKGLVMWQPNGTIIRDEVEKLAVQKEASGGYKRVVTPHLAKKELFLTSGHLPYYEEDMYPKMEMDDGTYYLKAMNCPHHHIMYRHEPRSYRDLPLRLAEYGTVYRNERSGTLAGLLRVRGLCMNDAHIYCRKDQIKSEFEAALRLTMEYFEIFGLKDYWFRLSKWDPNKKEKYIDEPENWDFTENEIRNLLVEMGVKFVEAEDEAAFYGPKVDIQFKSVIGRTETMSTVQLDFAAKKRFELTYKDDKGEENGDVFVIHRAPLSTHERFIAFLIEHYGGTWPIWLSPRQVNIIPIGENESSYAHEVRDILSSKNIRVEIDESSDSLGKKIRNSKISKTPYTLVIGQKEVEDKSVTVEKRGEEKGEVLKLEDFVKMIEEKIITRDNNL